jgi:ABC-type sugar transport system ATPase subunit
MRDLREDGRAILYISHHLSEVLRVADRVTVMRNGRRVTTVRASEVDEDGLIRFMIAKGLDNQYPRFHTAKGDEIFAVAGYSAPSAGVRDVTFSIRSGEIVGFAGLVGAGRTELARSIFVGVGARGSSGTVTLNGAAFRSRNPGDSIRRGIVMIPENHREEGLIADMDVGFNLTFPKLDLHTRFGFVSGKNARASAMEAIEKYGIRAFGLSQPARTLSGGNQQKVSVGKWNLAEAKLWIFDEPTQGIDVDAKTEIYSIMGRVAASGAGVWFIGSELRELTAISDRICVMKSGRTIAEYSPPYDRERILDSMIR